MPAQHAAEMPEMLDNPCKDPALDGSSLPTLTDGVLSASCQCGTTLKIRLSRITTEPPCPTCSLPAAEGIVAGPHRVRFYELLPRERTDGDNVVYFARIGNAVKIGTTGNISLRLSNLGQPELLGCMAGGFAEERRTHKRFTRFRLHGEWFADCPEIRAFINEHCEIPALRSPAKRPPAAIGADRLFDRQRQDF